MDHAQDEKIIKEFGENLKKMRLRKKLSLRKLADLANLSHNAIHEIEKGITNPSLTTIAALAEALGVDIGELARLK